MNEASRIKKPSKIREKKITFCLVINHFNFTRNIASNLIMKTQQFHTFWLSTNPFSRENLRCSFLKKNLVNATADNFDLTRKKCEKNEYVLTICIYEVTGFLFNAYTSNETICSIIQILGLLASLAAGDVTPPTKNPDFFLSSGELLQFRRSSVVYFSN